MTSGRTLLLLSFFLTSLQLYAQLPDSCKLRFGTNISGITDYSTELPFVDRMKNCRTWYTKDVGNLNGSPFNTEAADSMSFRADGYPTHIPQSLPGRPFQQKVATIWAITDGWTPGQYVVLFDGKGKLGFWGGLSNLTQTGPNRYTFDFNQPVGSILEMTIDSSAATDPVRNIRVVHSDHENTYLSHPFNPVWLDKLLIFRSVRFMDWGRTNSWGQAENWEWDNPHLFDWSERSKMDHYTWSHNKGVPYEMMIRLMNDYDLDGWVCVPHNADDDYIRNMAQLFHDQLEPERKLTVEYSNEIWNWIFGQTQWLHEYGCLQQNASWPEGIVPYVQNCMDIWTDAYSNDLHRLTRAVGVQTAWLDVSQRIVFNLQPGSFDVVSPAYYFGLNDSTDAVLDVLGPSATAADVAGLVRAGWYREKAWMTDIKTKIADSLGLPIAFYEGGQHITPVPFGVTPTYEQALLDIQRDTAIYNLYNEWFTFMRTLQSGGQPLLCMNFSFIGQRSARYGSWGILETMTQDTALIPAPKYRAVLENMDQDCLTTGVIYPEKEWTWSIYPNPTNGIIRIENGPENCFEVKVHSLTGYMLYSTSKQNNVDISELPAGAYVITVQSGSGRQFSKLIVKL